LVSADLVLMSEESFRAFFDYPTGHYTDIALSVANPPEVRNVALKLAAACPTARPILRDEVLRTYASIYDWREGIVLALLSGRDPGLRHPRLGEGQRPLRRGAARDRHPQGHRLGNRRRPQDEVLGRPADLADRLPRRLRRRLHPCLPLRRAMFEPVLKGWAVLYPRFQLTPHIDGLQVATLFFFTVVPYTAAVLVPIWKAAITDP
jgi:hypothetical protein